jgi:hypothetical protein
MSNPRIRRRITFAIIFLLLLTSGVNAQTPCSTGTSYRECPACGTAKSVKVQRDNVLKNRDEPAANVKVLTVDYIRNPINNDSFYANMAVEVTGYVAKVVGGAVRESPNCGRSDLRGIHVYIVARWSEEYDQSKYVVVEITPRWEKKLGLDDDGNFEKMLGNLRKQIMRKWVKFRGWMFYDSVHIDQAESTNPGNAMNWRATPWEIHPVTYYEVLSRQPSD